MAGTWTTNNYLFIPPPGSEYDAQFTTAFERTDAQLHLLSQVQSFYRLKVVNNALTPATKIDITADAVTVMSAGGTPYILRSFSKTVNCGTTGADGLDTGTLSVNNWYYFYCIAKADGTMAGLASLSATTPTMPTDYVYKKLVSAIYYKETGVLGVYSFQTINQVDRMVKYSGGSALGGTKHAFEAASATATSVDLSTRIPSNALSMEVQIANIYAYSVAIMLSWDNSGTGLNPVWLNANQSDVTFGFNANATVVMPPINYLLNPSAPQTIFITGFDSNTRGRGYITGYELDI